MDLYVCCMYVQTKHGKTKRREQHRVVCAVLCCKMLEEVNKGRKMEIVKSSESVHDNVNKTHRNKAKGEEPNQ